MIHPKMGPAFPHAGASSIRGTGIADRQGRKPIPALAVESRPQLASTGTAMDHAFLCVVCSGLLVLVTAFALATPSIKSTRPQADEAVLVHLLAHSPCQLTKQHCF